MAKQLTIIHSSECSDEKKTFSGVQDLIDYLNKIKPKEIKSTFDYASLIDKRVAIKLAKNEIIYLDKRLAMVLGFSNSIIQDETTKERKASTVPGENDDINSVEWLNKQIAVFKKEREELKLLQSNDAGDAEPGRNIIIADHFSDLRIHSYNMYVYSNLVRTSIVGHTEVPLLRAIPIESDNDGKHIGLSFDRLHFRPLSSNFFEYIDIRLTNDLGEDLNFKSGKVIVTLYIRRKLDRRLMN